MPVGLANIQIVDYHFEKNTLETYTNDFTQKISQHLSCIIKRNNDSMLVCGNTFLSGEHGIFIAINEHKKTVLEHMVLAIQEIINGNPKLNDTIDIILIKDFASASVPVASRLEKMNFSPIIVDPAMVLQLNPRWNSFDDYLKDFRSKFRVKAKKAYKDSQDLIVKPLTGNDIETHYNTLVSLYQNVIKRSSFNIATLEINTYKELKKQFPSEFILNTYWLNDNMVGFATGMINKGVLDAHYIGLDYDVNASHSVYSRILYDYVKLAIKLKLKAVNFGRTSGEIKSSLGAVPEELTFYLRHRKSFTNLLFKPFLKRIKPQPFEQRHPFKKNNAVSI